MEPAPPWARFPDYEHGSIGWRMGTGESYLGTWWAHLASVPLPDREAYLRRHPAAPHSWYETVWAVLGEDEAPDEDGVQQLVDRNLIASDIAYRTWTRDVQWPWELGADIRDAARYETRRLSFLSRAMRASPRDPAAPVPHAWKAARQAVQTGEPGPLNPQEGLTTLAILLCAGEVLGPWTLGLQVEDFQDSFEHDMNYADAFRLWMMAVFDDVPHLEREIVRLNPPPTWQVWMQDQTYLPTDED